MSEIKLSCTDYLLVPAAMVAVMTDSDKDEEDRKRSMLDRLRDKIAFARAQPLDIYLGSRFL